MKKFICLLLAAILTLGLVACGDNTNANKTNPTDDISPSGENSTIGPSTVGDQPTEVPKYNNLQFEDGYDYWGTTSEIAKPEIPQLTWDEKDVDGVIMHVANTPFEFDSNGILEAAKKNKFLRSLASDIYEYQSESHLGTDSSQYGYYTQYTYYDNVVGEYEKNKAAFIMYASKEPDHHNNYDCLWMRFYNLKIGSFAQKDIYDAAKLVFGEYADFLVYGQDSDGMIKKDSSEKLKPLQIIDYIEYDDCSYKIVRTVKKGEQEDVIDIEMFIEVYKNKNYDLKKYFYQDSSLIFKENAYTPSAIMSESFGETDPCQGEKFGVAGLSKFIPSYTAGKIEYWNVAEETHEDGTTVYEFSIKDRYYDKKNRLEGNVWYNIDIEKKGEQVQSLTFNFDNHWGLDEIKTDSQEYIDHSIEMMQELFNITIPAIVYNGDFRNAVDIVLEIDGVEYSGEFDVNHNAGTCGIDLIYKSES